MRKMTGCFVSHAELVIASSIIHYLRFGNLLSPLRDLFETASVGFGIETTITEETVKE